jgi:glycosyltransferase involved in cell wall biosynthesis
MNILIVTPDITGPIRNGGIGTAFGALALSWAEEGYGVSVLYALGSYAETESIKYWKEYYQSKNIELIPLPSFLDFEIDASEVRARSYRVYSWLKEHESKYDMLIAPEWRADIYYALLSKHLGLSFKKLPMAIVTHSPTQWADEGNYAMPDNLDALDIHSMESAVVQWADILISPSHYMINWLETSNYQPTKKRRVIQNILLSLPNTETFPKNTVDKNELIELVFFGRLEARKGLELFLNAIKRLPSESKQKIKSITFLGKKIASYHAEEKIEKALNPHQIKWKIIDHLDHVGAQNYLSSHNRVAVIPSLVENSPYTVLECMGRKIPFIASDVGGIAELINGADRGHVLFAPNPSSLANRIEKQLTEGFRVSESSVGFQQTLQQWIELPLILHSTQHVEESAMTSFPKVSVCLVHYNRPTMLAEAIASLRGQTYTNFEIILVDDGSTDTQAIAYLHSLEKEFEIYGWKIIRQDNAYLGAARNNAVSHATGEYIMFMDDDNIAKPHEIETFIKAALNSGADILTTVSDVFMDEIPKKSQRIWLPLGGFASPGLFNNVFGDANALIRKNVFDTLGGFTEDYGVGHEDWEFFAKAVLNGYKLFLVPEPLFFYRVQQNSMFRTGQTQKNDFRSLRPYLNQTDISGALGYALFLQTHTASKVNLFSINEIAHVSSNLIRNITGSSKKIAIQKFIAHTKANGLLSSLKKTYQWLRK